MDKALNMAIQMPMYRMLDCHWYTIRCIPVPSLILSKRTLVSLTKYTPMANSPFQKLNPFIKSVDTSREPRAIFNMNTLMNITTISMNMFIWTRQWFWNFRKTFSLAWHTLWVWTGSLTFYKRREDSGSLGNAG